MPEKAKVVVYHGPYDSFGQVEHRETRLEGLLRRLVANDHEVSFRRSPDRDDLQVWVNGQRVFACDIKQLDFGGDGELDPRCEQILQAVNDAY